MPRVESALVCVCLLGACGRGETPAAPPSSGGAPAAVSIGADIVREIARQRSVPLERARELAEEDALLAAELQRREPALALSLERLALARELSQSLLQDADRRGPPSDEEIAELTSQRWWALDRPRMVEVVHAVVLSESENPEAAALAERIATAVAQATNAREFEQAAKAVPADDQQVRVETLPPVAPDGRAVSPDRPPPQGQLLHLAVEFAAAAQKLERVGQLSPVVRSPFGYHVLMALKIWEPLRPTQAELRELLRPEVAQRRAIAEQQRVLTEQRQQSAPQQERSALSAIAQLARAR